LSCHATPDGAAEQNCHVSGSGVTAFSKSETPSNVTYVAAPMHVSRQRYLVTKGSNPQKKLEAFIIKILNKKGLKWSGRLYSLSIATSIRSIKFYQKLAAYVIMKIYSKLTLKPLC